MLRVERHIDVLLLGDQSWRSTCPSDCQGSRSTGDAARGALERELGAQRSGGIQWNITHVCSTSMALAAIGDTAQHRFDVGVVVCTHPDPRVTRNAIRALHLQCASLPLIVISDIEDRKTVLSLLRAGAEEHLQRRHVLKQEPGDGILWRALSYVVERRKVTDLEQRLVHVDRLASIGALASGVAHEINNPCAYVLANLDVMLEEIGKLRGLYKDIEQLAQNGAPGDDITQILKSSNIAKRIDDLEEITADNIVGTERIQTIVRGLGNFARSDEDEWEELQLDSVVEAAHKMVANEIKHVATLEINLQPTPAIRGSYTKLEQILTNLLLNASHAIHEKSTAEPRGGHRITIASKNCGDYLCLSVKDTGCGIPKNVQARVFEPFFTTKARNKGTGLGLALCAEMVEMHGGSMRMQSELGVGSTFEILLPIPAQNTTQPQPIPQPSTHQPKTVCAPFRRRVLLIDDDPTLLRSMRRMLHPHHDVITAQGGRKAIALLRQDQQFDAVVCDLMMPEIDAPTVYDALSHIAPELQDRFIVCSGGAFTARGREFVSQFNRPLLEKPMRTHTFLRRIEDVAITHKKGRLEGRPLLRMVEPNGVEPSTS